MLQYSDAGVVNLHDSCRFLPTYVSTVGIFYLTQRIPSFVNKRTRTMVLFTAWQQQPGWYIHHVYHFIFGCLSVQHTSNSLFCYAYVDQNFSWNEFDFQGCRNHILPHCIVLNKRSCSNERPPQLFVTNGPPKQVGKGWKMSRSDWQTSVLFHSTRLSVCAGSANSAQYDISVFAKLP